jgi:glycosyltransferase involved in cell wall biosynthesis
MALARSHKVFFQNPDDRSLFLQSKLVAPEVCSLLPGSGIDLRLYQPAPTAPLAGRQFTFLMIARMLRDKGLEEYVGAARKLRSAGGTARFQLLGATNANNPNAVPREVIEQWENDGLVEYLGVTDDVRPYIAAADCVVLPSYREGVPRSLLEAAAMARPIVATDVAGCREAVDDTVNGFLCEVRNASDLAAKMDAMLCLTEDQRSAMGEAGRKKVETQFDERLVIQKYLYAMAGVTSMPQASRAPSAGNGESVAER